MAAEGASSQHAEQEQVEGLGAVPGLEKFVNGGEGPARGSMSPTRATDGLKRTGGCGGGEVVT